MIERIEASAIATTMADENERRDRWARRRAATRQAARAREEGGVSIADALAAADAEAPPVVPGTAAGTVTAMAIARRIAAAGAGALAMQARIGPAAVRRLVRAGG